MGRGFVVCEDAPGSGGPYYTPRPQLLVLEERRESLVVAAILKASDKHFVLLTAHDSSREIAISQIVDALRQYAYDLPVSYCVKGKVSPELRLAYEALTVNQVWSVPLMARSSAPEAIQWINSRGGTESGGLTILEV